MIKYYTKDRIIETWKRAEAAGINTVVSNNETEHVIQAVTEYLSLGGSLQWIAQIACRNHSNMGMPPSQYDPDWLLRPIRKINEKLIIDEWENIQRIIVSLALKTTTQSILIGKLSSCARKNRTKRALWEYDNIIRSLYLLDYIDSLSLRRNVQRALNQGESYHKLHKAVSYANFGRLRFKTEQQIWNDCGRLIANLGISHFRA